MPLVGFSVKRYIRKGLAITRVDELNAQVAKLEAEREETMRKERANVLAKTEQNIKRYGFKTSDFKSVHAKRKKRRSGGVASQCCVIV